MRSTVTLTFCVLVSAAAFLPGGDESCYGAGTLVSTGGFEDRASGPDFEAIALEGQNGWLATPGTDSSATVTAMPGGQRLHLEHNTVDRRWGVLPASSYTPAGRYVTVSWDMSAPPTLAQDVLGPFFGVEAYAANGGYTLLGSFGIDATTGELLIQQAQTGYLVAPGMKITDGGWHRYTIELDYLEDKYRTYLDGGLIATTSFVDDDKQELDTFSDADISTFSVAASGGAGQDGTDMAWIDNFLVVDGIPGDYNHDGLVNLADYTVWRNTLTTSGLTPPADGNGDGTVGTDDYLLWKQNFGRSNTLSGSLVIRSRIPEPTGWALTSLAIGGFFTRLRRR